MKHVIAEKPSGLNLLPRNSEPKRCDRYLEGNEYLFSCCSGILQS
jgi:hypothetical protein